MGTRRSSEPRITLPYAVRRDLTSAAGIGIPSTPETGLYGWLPGLWVLRHYQRAWLLRDVVAGLVLTSLLVPAGMGYAVAAGLPPITGLYATIAPLLSYALFGPSRIMVLGPDSALAALIAAAVVAPAAGDPERAVAMASVLALLTGLLCVAGGAVRLGFLTDLLSSPVRVGYMNGIGLTVLVSQLPKLLGFSVQASGVPGGVRGLASGVATGRTEPLALALGGACLALILLLQRFAPRVPGVLLAVVGATLAVKGLGLSDVLAVVGPVPSGVPLPRLPLVRLEELGGLATAALGIALVSFADTSVLSRTFSSRHGYRVDPNRELVGLGMANLAAGLFQGFPVSSSSSRTPVAESAGARTQVTGVVGALAVMLLLAAAPALLRDLPTTALAAVVIAAALRILDVSAMRSFFRVRRSDFVLAVLAFLAVVGLGVLSGIALAVGFSMLDFVRRAWRPHDAVLGRAAGVTGFHDVKRYPDAKQVPGLIVFRWDAPLFFANAEGFHDRVLEVVDDVAEEVKWLVVAAEPITDVDTTAAEMISALDADLTARGVELAFAEMKDPVKDRLMRYGLHDQIGRQFFFPTVGSAVRAFIRQHQPHLESEAPAAD